MWQLLLELQSKWGWELAIAHCDHGWELDAGLADHVTTFAQSQKAQFYLCKTNPETPLPPTEAAARDWRYAALTEIAQTYNFTYVVTGHTLSDRAETLLYNLFRGSGADGLQSLSWQRPLAPDIHLIRPLLDISRSETGDFCRQYQLPVWEDAYNQDPSYARSRIRHQLLPRLRQDFHPQVEVHLAQTAELLQADVAYLEAQAAEVLYQARQQVGDLACLQCAILAQVPLALQRRVLRQFLRSTAITAPTFSQIEELISLITAPNQTRTSTFPKGGSFRVQKNQSKKNCICYCP